MMLYLRMSACWLEHTRLQMIERVRVTMSVISFFTATSTQKRGEKRKKKMRAEMGSIPHPRLPRLTTPKARKENPIENIPRRALPRRGPLPRLRVRLVCPFAFPSRGSPSQPLKQKQSGTHHFTRKKNRNPTPKRPRTMLVRPWRCLSGETPIRLQIP